MAKLILEFGNASCYPCINLDATVANILSNISFQNRPVLQNYFSKNSNNSFTVKDAFFHPNKEVPDVYIYDLRRYRGEWRLFSPNSSHRNTAPLKECTKINCSSECSPSPKKIAKAKNILVILESPHDEEYDNNFNPLQPANSSKGTGSNFFNNFTKHILPILCNSLKIKLYQKKVYRICFVEPVPYQSSLHFIHKQDLNSNKNKSFNKLRNEVWKSLFVFCKDDFIKRIESYEPFIIINACTGEKNTDSLRKEVKEAIDEIVKNNPKSKIARAYKFRTNHPCAWKSQCFEWNNI